MNNLIAYTVRIVLYSAVIAVSAILDPPLLLALPLAIVFGAGIEIALIWCGKA